MTSHHLSVPTPTLKILPINNVHPHEEHDAQRALPLMKKLQEASHLTNPPIVAPIDNKHYVVLDGANRYHALKSLGYEHILVQVAPYESEYVELQVWHHIISDWDSETFLQHIRAIDGLNITHGWDTHAIARISLKSGVVLSLDAITTVALGERNALLCQIVHTYQKNARLDRTALSETAEVWELYPSAVALLRFPHYQPHDIMMAAKQNALIPPGISRHIIHGRALQLYYPLNLLKDDKVTLAEKNQALQDWIKQKFAQRAVRFYAESTYQFNE